MFHPPPASLPAARKTPRREVRPHPDARGSVLIIVLWVAFGLVSLALYFAQSMAFELRAADNRTAAAEADLAIAGAQCYLSNLLATVETPGTWPEETTYQVEAVPVGQALFWIQRRPDDTINDNLPSFGLIDEASKLNLNTATQAMLEALPRMTPELAAAIIDWRDADEDVTSGGAESDIYLRRKPAYRCKNAPFESIGELRLVAGAELDILYGEDRNLNDLLDPNENDGEFNPPSDNADGRLDRGLFAFVTVHSRQANTRTDGSPRINVASASTDELRAVLEEKLSADAAAGVLAAVGSDRDELRSVLEFYARSEMSEEDFEKVAGDLTITNAPVIVGLINVNTATAEVLACVPGIGPEKADELIASRQRQAQPPTSAAWVKEILGDDGLREAGPFLTGSSFQTTADVAAVGRYGRGFRRVRFTYDTTEGAPKLVARQDLTPLGWSLGPATRQLLTELAQLSRP